MKFSTVYGTWSSYKNTEKDPTSVSKIAVYSFDWSIFPRGGPIIWSVIPKAFSESEQAMKTARIENISR